MAINHLDISTLFQCCDAAQFAFKTTAEVQDLTEFIGQPRAVEAVRFAIGVKHKGYNLFASGAAGMGKQSLVERYASEQAALGPVPPDYCYVNNFQQPHKPRLLRLPPGYGPQLQADMEQLIEDLRSAIPAVFESEEYRIRSQGIEEEINARQEKAMQKIQDSAEKKHIALIATPTGFTLAPVRNGEVLEPAEYEKLPEDERKRIERDTVELQEQLRAALHEAPKWHKEGLDRIGLLNRELAASAVSHLIDGLRKKYSELTDVLPYFDEVEKDVIDNFRRFLREETQHRSRILGIQLAQPSDEMPPENRYRVNIIVSHKVNGGAPVIYADHPSYNNIIGRVEHRAQLGALITDFTMIRPGALHLANGGYLILDAYKTLTQPFAWEGLKRALKASEISIESLAQYTSLASTVSLEPQPIPLDIKVILLGEPRIYYLLSYYDPEFSELFKVVADFDDQMDRGQENNQLYAQLIATLIRQEKLRHFDAAAVARIIEQRARQIQDNEKLATHMSSLTDLLREADYWAGKSDKDIVRAADVERAIDARIYRVDRIRERINFEIQRGTLLIDTDGAKTGQVNGLSILDLGDFMFGRPSRITARVRIGEGNVVDIEREVELGGPIHSKGVFILSAFLGARYLLDRPLAVSASLVFEQSYGEIEGDSASSAELFALLSALADAPILQSLAVTGSVNQQGEIQAIGGVNEKIEGFFDTCKLRGLTGKQGVVIPASNVKNLMLRSELRDAVAAGKFHIYSIETIDDGISLLTGIAAGERGGDGSFPADSINRRVEEKLIMYSEKMRAYGGDHAAATAAEGGNP